jgi:hypothetical protein
MEDPQARCHPLPRCETGDAAQTRAAWIRIAVARVIVDSTDPAERHVVREALADLGYNAGAPGAAFSLMPDSEGTQ